MRRIHKIVIALVLILTIGAVGIYFAGSKLAQNVEPFLREQAIAYLRDRFDADVELKSIHIALPPMSKLKLWWTKGHGAVGSVRAEGIVLRRKNWPNEPPILSVRSADFHLDIGLLFTPVKTIPLIAIDGMTLNVPPKKDRTPIFKSQSPEPDQTRPRNSSVNISVLAITNTHLILRPKDPRKEPLDFDIDRIQLKDLGAGKPFEYEAHLKNPRPPGQIDSKGTFGPYMEDDPGSSPLRGDYVFSEADLGVFRSIAGILHSQGSFQGELSTVKAKGEATVRNFRLTRSNNPIPLHTRFEVLVDGTNGDTILQPVHARLGQSPFVTSGTIIKHDRDPRRTIDLKVHMTEGRIQDFIKLAMKDDVPFMLGKLKLDTLVIIPPLSGKVKEKLRLDGRFEITGVKFLRIRIQDKIDELSRRGQGQPNNTAIDDVISGMGGTFKMDDQRISFSRLSFDVPGAEVDLSGNYDIDDDRIDFRGTLRLVAKLSQTQTGWKRWLLKPVDPFFSKKGAGTHVGIKVVGSSRDPVFGRDKAE